MRSKQSKILLALAVVFFFVYSWFSAAVVIPNANQAAGQKIFSWPDEMADNFFINQFIQTNSFVKSEPLNAVVQDIVHPRSVNIFNHAIVPMGFLGMLIVYGWLGKLFGLAATMFFTPLFAVLGVLFFYGLIKEIFNRTVGFISALLLFCLAPFWYYANLGMLSTVPFVAFLIIGLYFFVRQMNLESHRHRGSLAFFSGLFISLALTVRLIEFVWVGILIIVPFIFYFKKINWKQVVWFLVGAIIPLSVMLYYNHLTYGQWLTVGYLKIDGTTDLFGRIPTEFNALNSYWRLIFIPFGFHARLILDNFNNYIVKILWPYFVLTTIGAIVWLTKIIRQHSLARKIHNQEMSALVKKEFVFFLTTMLAAAWIVFYYGNWLLADPLILKLNTIGSSYVRYFLPVQILMVPVIAWLLDRVLQLSASKFLRFSFIGLIIIGLTVYSYGIVYLTTNDGLFAQRDVINQYYVQARLVNEIVPTNAIIITDRADKLFFPQHRVVMFNSDYSIFPQLKKVAGETPVYYFSSLRDNDINLINKDQLGALGLKFVQPKAIDGSFRMFALELLKK